MASPVATLAVGLVAGVLSGAFGVGGGIATTPAIRLVLGYPALIAVGTPLPVIVPTALAGVWSYRRAGHFDVRAGMTIGLAGIPLSVAGAFASDLAGGRAVMLATAALIAYMAIDMLAGARRAPDGDAVVVGAARLIAIGAAAGIYSGFLGLGGGFVIVPALTRWTRMPIKRAIGTSLLAVCLLAVPGTLTHWWLGHVDLTLAAGLMVGVVPGALIGARLTHAADEKVVRFAFAALLAAIAIVLGLNEFGVLA